MGWDKISLQLKYHISHIEPDTEKNASPHQNKTNGQYIPFNIIDA